MARRKAWIWLVLALICAIGAGGLSFYVIDQQVVAAQQLAVPQPTPKLIPTVELPVAARNLERGLAITAADFVLKPFPVDLVPSSAISTTEELVGQVLIDPVAEGDIFRAHIFMGAADAPLSSSIEEGKTLLAFPVVDLIGQMGLIVDGDRVDLLLTNITPGPDGAAGERKTGYTVQNVEVVRVLRAAPTEENPSPTPKAFLLQLTPEDALMVKLVKDSGGTIDLALRSPLDQQPFEVAPATDSDLDGLMNNGAGGR